MKVTGGLISQAKKCNDHQKIMGKEDSQGEGADQWWVGMSSIDAFQTYNGSESDCQGPSHVLEVHFVTLSNEKRTQLLS